MFDLICVLPIEIIPMIIYRRFAYHPVWRINRALVVRRFFEYTEMTLQAVVAHWSPHSHVLLKLVAFSLFLVHINACLFAFVVGFDKVRPGATPNRPKPPPWPPPRSGSPLGARFAGTNF